MDKDERVPFYFAGGPSRFRSSRRLASMRSVQRTITQETTRSGLDGKRAILTNAGIVRRDLAPTAGGMRARVCSGRWFDHCHRVRGCHPSCVRRDR